MVNYSIKMDENMACAAGVNIRASQKYCIQIANAIRGKKIDKAKTFLNNVINMKQAVPMTRFNGDVGHKTKIGPGRFPVKACAAVLNVVETAEANARFKGLNVPSLVVYHISTKKGSDDWHYGRKRRRQIKQCHVEVVLKETEKAVKGKKAKKAAEKAEAKKEAAPEKAKAGEVKKEFKQEAKPVEPKKEKVEEKPKAAEKKEIEKKPETKVEKVEPKPVVEKKETLVEKKPEQKPAVQPKKEVKKVEEQK
jgi:large subunit ribosomal protein L22